MVASRLRGKGCAVLFCKQHVNFSPESHSQSHCLFRLLWGTPVAFLLQDFGQSVGLLHPSPSVCPSQRLLQALGKVGEGNPFLREIFLRKESRGCTVLWLVPLGEPRSCPWTRDLGDVQGCLFCSQSTGQPLTEDEAEMHASSYKKHADLNSQ